MMPAAWLVDPPVSNGSLLEHEHVGDTEFGQVIGGGDADDAGADDDGLRAIPHASQLPLRATAPWSHGRVRGQHQGRAMRNRPDLAGCTARGGRGFLDVIMCVVHGRPIRAGPPGSPRTR